MISNRTTFTNNTAKLPIDGLAKLETPISDTAIVGKVIIIETREASCLYIKVNKYAEKIETRIDAKK
jgi:hypothetical protein